MEIKTDDKEHLPLYGPGPVYVGIIIGLTLVATLCRNLPAFTKGRISSLRVPLAVAGVLLIGLGIFLWIQAVIVAKVDDGIKENRLVTTGIYAWVRNPIYSAFSILCTGVLLTSGNVFFLTLPFLYWLFLTVLMKGTEEKWLRNLYGQEYEDYCKCVNRCIPWFPKGR
ncbi:methyltransferase family protein [Lachnoclostridium sp. Marseille-P6806]|uniref:methyltransferase family protein n=1 Tax=Lachnoclostridium sp. Marseille-P6806 TaxID=2364793 RepID=UPI001031061C|nr:isoprenylcysteine carboxylmethyltransferase family protein [Lachnoclostridium sp. Marseille-P6806]